MMALPLVALPLGGGLDPRLDDGPVRGTTRHETRGVTGACIGYLCRGSLRCNEHTYSVLAGGRGQHINCARCGNGGIARRKHANAILDAGACHIDACAILHRNGRRASAAEVGYIDGVYRVIWRSAKARDVDTRLKRDVQVAGASDADAVGIGARWADNGRWLTARWGRLRQRRFRYTQRRKRQGKGRDKPKFSTFRSDAEQHDQLPKTAPHGSPRLHVAGLPTRPSNSLLSSA